MRRIGSGSSGRAVRPRHAGHAGRSHRALRRDLVAHRADAGGTRADEGQTGVGDPLGEVGVLRQKSVAWMDRLRPGRLGGEQDRRLVQIAMCGRWRADADGDVGAADVGASRSASEWAATVRSPSARQARWMRSAISPRLAIRTVVTSRSPEPEQRLGRPRPRRPRRRGGLDGAVALGLDGVEDLHGLDDAEGGAGFDGRARLRRRRARAGEERQVHGARQRARLTVKASAIAFAHEPFGADGSVRGGRHCGLVSVGCGRIRAPHEPQCPAVLGDLHLGEIRRGHRVDQRLDLGAGP